MNKFLDNYLLSGHRFSEDERLLAFQFKFLNIMLTLAMLVPPFISYLHREINPILVYSDNAFTLSSIILFFLLRRNKEFFKTVSLLFAPSLFIAITIVFFLAGDDPTKVIWAPIFFSCAFFLLDTRWGVFWVTAVLISYFLGYTLLGEEKIYYSLSELLLISIALIVIAIIFDAFKRKNEADHHTYVSTNIELRQKSIELENFNRLLESRINEALLENQSKTRALQRNLDLINRHIITAHIDLNGIITNVSEAYCKISKFGKQHFISRPFSLMFNANTDTQELKEIWTLLQEERIYTAEVFNYDKNLQSYWLDMNISPEYTAQDELIGFVMISHNITDKKLLLQHQEQLIAQSRHAAMGEMISMIAHQWRQPLSAVSAIASGISIDIALGKSNPDDLNERLQRISTQIQHLSHTITDFRDFFKPSKGIQNTYINKLVEEAVKLLEHRFDKISLEYKHKEQTCLALYRNELVQVLINIFCNACDVLEETQPDNPTITINEYIQDQDIIIEIGDNGGGIDEKIIGHIFDPYFSTKAKNGTGLGLYMSKTIIEDHQKGTISAHNEGDGALFRIRIPHSLCTI